MVLLSRGIYFECVASRLTRFTEWVRKNAQSLMHRHFAAVCNRKVWFSSKCSEINWWHEERANFEYRD